MNKNSIFKFILSWILLSCIVSTITNSWAQSPPTVTDFEQPFYGLKRQGTTANQKQVTLIVIGWQPRNKGEPVLTAPQIQNLFFGATNSVAHWFQENSQSRYRLIPHPTNAVMGPYLSIHDWRFYWRTGPFDPSGLAVGDPHRYVHTDGQVYYLDDDGFIGGHRHAWAEAIRAAANQINFSDFDRDNNGDLSVDECLVVIVKAQANNFGTRRSASGSDVPYTLLRVDGVTIRVVCELYAGPPHGTDDLAVAVEEVLHLAANLADQYPDNHHRQSNDPGRPGQVALTDAGSRPVHIDAYHKLKWGWLNSQVADHSGKYTLQNAATTGDALILYSPYFGTDEFFLMENRWRGTSYDRFRANNRGEGLALWHCIQDKKLSSNWARRAIHLRRVDPRLDSAGNIQWDLTLFDGAYPNRSYDLHDESTPQNLRFQNGMPSRIRLRNISNAGATMTVDVTVPPAKGDIIKTKGRVTMIRVHAKNTGYGSSKYQLNEDAVLTLDSDPGVVLGVDLNTRDGREMFDMLREAFQDGTAITVEYRAVNAIGGRIIRVIENY